MGFVRADTDDSWCGRLDDTLGYRTIDISARQCFVQLLDVAGCEFDTPRLGDWPTSAFRRTHASVQIVLSGGLDLRLGSRDETARLGSMAVHMNDHWSEHWLPERQRIVTVSWVPIDRRPTVGVVRLDGRALRVWKEIAESIEEAREQSEFRVITTRVRGALRCQGVEIPEFAIEAPSRAARVLQPHVDWAMCNLHRAPGWVDLERRTGLSARQLNRLWNSDADWLPEVGFRAALLRRKLFSAALMGYHADARRLGLARALGYGSDRALELALRSHSVPVPWAANRR